MRLDHGDDAAARAGAGRFQHGGDLHRMMAVVVVDRDAVPGAGELEAALHAGEARHRRADRVVGDAGLARRRDRRQRIERIVMAGQRHASSRAACARRPVTRALRSASNTVLPPSTRADFSTRSASCRCRRSGAGGRRGAAPAARSCRSRRDGRCRRPPGRRRGCCGRRSRTRGACSRRS